MADVDAILQHFVLVSSGTVHTLSKHPSSRATETDHTYLRVVMTRLSIQQKYIASNN